VGAPIFSVASTDTTDSATAESAPALRGNRPDAPKPRQFDTNRLASSNRSAIVVTPYPEHCRRIRSLEETTERAPTLKETRPIIQANRYMRPKSDNC
jgi:hypothetical protein